MAETFSPKLDRLAQCRHIRFLNPYSYGSMNDRREAWRPTLPPKANSVTIGASSSSEAIRGAAQHAFNRPSTAASTSQPTKSLPSPSARLAAAAAGSARVPVIPVKPAQNATVTTSVGSAAYSRGRPPPGVEKQSSNAGLVYKPTLSSTGQSKAQQGIPQGGSTAQAAARMASKSRSPARRIAYTPSAQDNALMPNYQSALLAGKAASSRSQDAPGPSLSHSQAGTPLAEQPTLSLKQIPYLPKKSPTQSSPDPAAGKLAGAAAAQAAITHAQPLPTTTSPRFETSPGFFPFSNVDSFSLSPDRSTFEESLVVTPTASTFASPIGIDIPISSSAQKLPGATASSNGAYIKDRRTGKAESSLADAIVASSLASSRAPSPTKVDASLRSTRRSRSLSHTSLPLVTPHFHHHQKVADSFTKTSHAVPRSLKHTLRKHSGKDEIEDDEEVTKRGRKHFMRKHPHKHHEGDRKRWRDRVTERERKRYEGVWAANRGLFTFWENEPGFGESWKRAPEADLVVNIVVRDIWDRSRLPKDVLEEIWDLVATSEDAQSLQRDQFVVGLWLIDQRLKGRKLPVRVSSDVWNSVRHTTGVKISRKPY